MRSAVLIAAIALSFACSTPPVYLSRGAEDLDTDAVKGEALFFSVDRTFQSECLDCVAIDIVENSKRDLLLVHRQPRCRLSDEGVLAAQVRPSDQQLAVEIRLNRTGMRSLSPCFHSVDDHEASLYLVVLNEKLVGTIYLSRIALEHERFVMFGGPQIELLYRALAPASPELREI